MSDEKSPVEELLDVVLYAPIGFVFSAREVLPGLAEKGKAQLGMAKTVGRFAAQQGQIEAGKLLDTLSKQVMATLQQLAGGVDRADGAPASSPQSSPNGAAPVVDEPVVEAPTAPTSGPEAAELAIPDYDSLSASQVLPRLAGLSAAELEAVRAYEAAHRGRKTILNRAAQLQAS